MRTMNYALEGKGVPSTLRGKVVRIRLAETPEDRLILAGGDEANVTAKFNDGYVIADQARLRQLAAKEGATLESLQAFSDSYTYVVKATGTGTPREVKPETKQNRIAASSANKNFEKALTDKQFYDRGVKFGFIDEAEFAEWKTAREAAQMAAKIDEKQAAETAAK